MIHEPANQMHEACVSVIEGLSTLSKLALIPRDQLSYCEYTAAIETFAQRTPTFLDERFPDYLTLASANTWLGATTILAGIIGTIVGGRWADWTQRHHPVNADTGFDEPANKRGVHALLRICAIGMVWAAPLSAA